MKTLREGSYIKHAQYGLGVITGTDREYTSIDFDLHGPKKFLTSLMTIEAAEGTPPQRPKTKSRKKGTAASPAARPSAGTR